MKKVILAVFAALGFAAANAGDVPTIRKGHFLEDIKAFADEHPATSQRASGGDIVYAVGDCEYHIFTKGGTLALSGAQTADILLVGGGGGAGWNGGGGGGGGAFVELSNQDLAIGSYTVAVGAGGAAAYADSKAWGQTGGTSSISGITGAAAPGGTGGIGWNGKSATPPATAGGQAGVAGNAAGGNGGAAGGSGDNSGADGSAGSKSLILGVEQGFAGGGGGGGHVESQKAHAPSYGQDGGGNGAGSETTITSKYLATSGEDGLGGGGGGGASGTWAGKWQTDGTTENKSILQNAGDGGDGIVIVRLTAAGGGEPSHTHDWSEWVTTVAPQVGVPGEKQRTCACGEVETEVIPALPDPVADDAALNFGSTAKTIRPKLHGAAFAPRLRLRGVMPDYMDELKALNLTLCRTHDLTLHDGSERIFDTHFLFPIFSCDETVDANYYFKATDAAVKDIQSCGMNLVFRLGSSIDNRGSGYSTSLRYNTVDPGTDNYAKYARVLSHIVLHYAAAPYNVKYFEIWNEASNANGNDRYATWQKPGGGVGDLSNFNAFFATCLAQIKGDLATAGYTDVKVGGPAYCSWQQGNMENLMNKCREKGVYPDFISWHNYPNDTANVTALKDDAATADTWLNGYCSGKGIDRSKIELSINEWHVYANGSAWELGEDAYKLGVFTIGTLIALQDSKLDQAQFYGSGYETSFAYLDPTSGQTGYQYAALKMFGEVVKNYTKRYPGIDNGAVSDSYFAATNEDGTKGCVVVADMSNNASVNLSMAGLSAVSNVKAYALDKGRKMTELSSGFSVTVTGVSVTKAQSAPGAYLFTFDMVKAN